MANLDLNGFITPEESFSGLDNITSSLQRNKLLAQQEADRQQKESDRLKAQQNAQSEFFTNSLNKKDNLTGTLYDGNINTLLGNALTQAQKLSSQGAQTSDIQMAVQPLIDQVNTYQAKARLYSANQKAFMDNMKGVNGYNLDKIKQLADQKAFYDTDPNTGQPVLNADKADPSHDYYTDVIKQNPDLVTNSGGIEDLINKYKPDVTTGVVKRTDPQGGFQYRKTKISANPYMTTDKNGDVVPQYEIAHDGGTVLKDDTGQPIRVLPQQIFDNMLSSKEGMSTADWLKGQLRQLGDSTDFKNANSSIAARHILWQQLKDRTPVHLEDVDNIKDNPIHYSTNIYANTQPQTIDLYNGDKNNVGLSQVVDSDVQNVKSKFPAGTVPYTNFSSAPQQVQTTLIKQARDITGDKSLNNSNLYFHKDDNGDINLYQISGNDPKTNKPVPNIKQDTQIMTVDPLTLNIPANQSVAKVGTGKTKPQTINKVINTGSAGVKSGGMSDDEYKAFLKKNNLQ